MKIKINNTFCVELLVRESFSRYYNSVFDSQESNIVVSVYYSPCTQLLVKFKQIFNLKIDIWSKQAYSIFV